MNIILGLSGSVIGGFGGLILGGFIGNLVCKICSIDTNGTAGIVRVLTPGDFLIFGSALLIAGVGATAGFILGITYNYWISTINSWF